MRKIKQARTFIIFECLHCQNLNRSTGISRYFSQKNRKNTPKKLILKKYCSISKTHQLFHELK